ncbi:hypothetical protein T459_12769 [Capsicum annuum]|uniref:Ternary complex factor MIP1 leucine-zipper domain-containing protein n=1 Tax=Capsicum annuum TaxID=4072 RepID=A0A2G2ZQR2_CAPAN|nr:hypothetical protein T459_12769 [Capsicum annuum]
MLDGPLRSVRRPAILGRTPAKKNLSMESIDIPFDEEDEIQRLEAIKADLQTRIEEESKGNALLQQSLEKRKDALHVRRLALEKDVKRLQDQLHKERELRILLEAELEGKLPVSSSKGSCSDAGKNQDGMMKEEIQDIAQAEADVINLKQRADSGNQPQQSQNNQGKSKDKHKDTESNASKTHEKSARSKETNVNKADSEKDNKHEAQSKQVDSSVEAGMSKAPSAGSKKSTSKSEASFMGANNTTSALSKLTNRLNFLKERRTQIAHELQHLDKNQSDQPVKNKEKGKGSESHHPDQPVKNKEKGKGSESHHPDKVQASQSQASEKNGSDDGQSIQHPDLDKGKSDSLPNPGKGPAAIPTRTNSR